MRGLAGLKRQPVKVNRRTCRLGSWSDRSILVNPGHAYKIEIRRVRSKSHGRRVIPGKLGREGSVEPVTFTEEFSALEQKSLNQIIATKIHKELSELRSRVDTSPTIPKRWVWELVQNAKDVNVGGKVAVRIEADLEDPDAHVTFSHNGGRSLLRISVFLSSKSPLKAGRKIARDGQ
jgi:hypothetical protein